jgi:hypothetical protein
MRIAIALLALSSVASAQPYPPARVCVNNVCNLPLQSKFNFLGNFTGTNNAGLPATNLITSGPLPFTFTPYNLSYSAIVYMNGSITNFASGDANNDGNLDFFAFRSAGSGITYRSGNGDGTFQEKTIPPANNLGPLDVLSVGAVLLFDADKDGNLDVLWYDTNAANTNFVVLFFKGNGNGTFNAVVTSTVGANPTGLFNNNTTYSVGDVTGDGNTDIVGAANNNVAGCTSVRIAPGNGDGTFGSMISVVASPDDCLRAPAVVDLNGDGRLDIVAGRATVPTAGIEGVCSILNQGGGSWGAPVCISTANNMRAIATADINGDGKQDVVGTSLTSNRVTTLLGTGTGAFTTETVYGPLTNIPIGPPSLADLDGDGDKDLAVQLSNPGSSAYMAIFLNNGSGVFGAPSYLVSTSTGGSPAPPQLYDYNHDGRIDIIGGNNFPEITLAVPNGFVYQAYSSTANFDCNANQSIAMTLTANLGSWTISQAPAGKICTITLIQGDAGTRTIGSPPVCSATQSAGGSCIVWAPTTYLSTNHATPTLTAASSGAADVFVLQSFALTPPSSGSGAGMGGQGTEWMEVQRCLNCTHP